MGTGGEEATSGCRSTGARSVTTGTFVDAYVHLVSLEAPAHVVIHSRSKKNRWAVCCVDEMLLGTCRNCGM